MNVSPSYRGREGPTLGRSLPVCTLPPLCCWQQQLFPKEKEAAVTTITPSLILYSSSFKRKKSKSQSRHQDGKRRSQGSSRCLRKAGAGSSPAKSSGRRSSPGSTAFTRQFHGREQQLPYMGDCLSQAVTSSGPCSQDWKLGLLPLH